MLENIPVKQEQEPARSNKEIKAFESSAERLFSEMHRTATVGVTLAKYLEISPHPTIEELGAIQDLSVLPTWGKRLVEEVVTEWNVLCRNCDEMTDALDARSLDQSGKTDPSIAKKRIAEFRAGTGRDYTPKGNIRLEKHAAYLVIGCDDKEDYAFFASGNVGEPRSSAGEYHHSMSFSAYKNIDETVIWIDQTKPPPRRAKFNWSLPVLLVADWQNEQEQKKTFDHEQQHLINARFAKIYGEGKHSNEGSFLQKLRDEVIAGIREGETRDAMIDRLATDNEVYRRFLGGTEDDQVKRKQIVPEIANALNEPGARLLFDSPEGRTLLAFHLMAVPVARIAERIRLLTEYLTKQFSTFPPLKEADMPPHPGAACLQVSGGDGSNCSMAARSVIDAYLRYKRILQLSVTNADLHPDQELKMAYKAYFQLRDEFCTKFHFTDTGTEKLVLFPTEKDIASMTPPPRRNGPPPRRLHSVN